MRYGMVVLLAVGLMAGAQSLRKPRQPAVARTGQVKAVVPPDPGVLGQDTTTQPGDLLGFAIDLFHDGVITGTHRADGTAENQGAVDVFRRRTPTGGLLFWERDMVAGVTNGRFMSIVDSVLAQPGGYLGRAVSANEQYAVIGAPGVTLEDMDWPNDAQAPDSTDANPDGLAGAAVVLVRGGTGWTLHSELVLPETDLLPAHTVFRDRAGWRLGWSVAIDGDFIALGAPFAAARSGGTAVVESGAVAIYRKATQGWSLMSVLTGQDIDSAIWPHGPRAMDYFGLSISLRGHRLAIGVPNAERSTEDIGTDRGVVHIFEHAGNSWVHQETVHPEFPYDAYWHASGWFGRAVSLTHTSLAVGQPGYLHLANTPPPDVGRGMAWVIERDVIGAWSVVSPLEPPFPPPNADWSILTEGGGYGSAISNSFCRVAVGTPGGDWSTPTGSVYLWERSSAGNWAIDHESAPSTAVAGDQWGRSVAIGPHWLAAGGWLADNGTDVDAGAVMVLPVACDCNGNGIDDDDEIAACTGDPADWECPADGGVGFTSTCVDCDGNGVIDACELCNDIFGERDCNGNGILDACEIAPPGTTQWSANSHHYVVVPDPLEFDEARLAAEALGPSAQLASAVTFFEAGFISSVLGWDVTNDGTAWLGGLRTDTSGAAHEGWTWLTDDPWLIDQAWWEAGQPDDPSQFSALMATSQSGGLWRWSDVSSTSVTADAFVAEFDADCNGDGVLDECQIADDVSLDCDGDGRLDSCQIDDAATAGVDLDCNNNDILDSCDLATDPSLDCNGNGALDACDIATGASIDCNGDGVPDECAGADLIINEIHADPAPTLEGDANGDGTTHSLEDQFVELVNISANVLDIAAWSIDIDGQQHVFAPFTSIDPGCAIVVFGGGSPTGSFGSAQVVTASTGSLDMETTQGTLSVFDDADALVASVTWGIEAASNQSLTRDPDRCGDWAKHRDAAPDGARFSPGTTITGIGFCLVDADGDGVDDSIDNCDEYNPAQVDCGPGGPNGIGDTCDIRDWIDGGGDQADLDCDFNGALDECQIAADPSLDCDLDGRLDLCQIVDSGFTMDCNGNGVLDTCEIADGLAADCNVNTVPDWCDINVYGTSTDLDDDGVPDECTASDPCDLNGDGIVDSSDLLQILSDFGCVAPPSCPGDFNGDGVVNTDDLLDFLSEGCI